MSRLTPPRPSAGIPAQGFLLPGLAAAALALGLQPAAAFQLPQGAGLDTVRHECARCHPLKRIAETEGKTRADWEHHVVTMTDIERRPANLKAVVDYLSAHFPPGS
ncbi:MAG: hypothetical protein AB7U46_03085 [Paenirhodobacter sp.]|uniref:hypothetical protein n=1 Tax=Paenirhodobacter sp. TaxID=1965326 RepID=UPI003D0C94FB